MCFSRDIEVLTGEKQECDGHVEKLKSHQLVLQSKCVHSSVIGITSSVLCLLTFFCVLEVIYAA